MHDLKEFRQGRVDQDLHLDFAQIALAKEGSLIHHILKPLLLKIALWKGRGVTFDNQFFPRKFNVSDTKTQVQFCVVVNTFFRIILQDL